MAPTGKLLCSCGCRQTVSRDTERRHRQNKASSALQASIAAKGQGPLAPLLSSNLRAGGNLSSRSRLMPVSEPAPTPMNSETPELNEPVDVVMVEGEAGGKPRLVRSIDKVLNGTY